MLEIFGILLLCSTNRKNSLARGRKPGIFVLLTILLWLGFEFVSIFIGFSMGLKSTDLYGVGILSAVIGGLLSYLIAKNCKEGTYVPSFDKLTTTIMSIAEPLNGTATLEIVCKKVFLGSRLGYNIRLNGQNVGTLKSGRSITASTNQKQNILRASDAFGQKLKPYTFVVESGSDSQISFRPGKFQLISPKVGIPTSPPTFGVRFCGSCGAKVTLPGAYCTSCGEIL